MTTKTRSTNGQGQLEVLPLDALYVHTTDRGGYQRGVNGMPANMKHVRELSERWDEYLGGVLVVNERPDGTLALIDGSHRRSALLMRGEKEYLCSVYKGLTVQQEAQIFHDLNKHRLGLKPHHSYNALLIAQDPIAISVETVLKEQGFHRRDGGVTNPNQLQISVSMLEFVRVYGVDHLRRALGWLASTWPSDTDSRKGPFVMGLCYFSLIYADAVRSDPAKRWKKTASIVIWQKAQARRAAEGGALAFNIAKTLTGAYNLGTTTGDQLPESRLDANQIQRQLRIAAAKRKAQRQGGRP